MLSNPSQARSSLLAAPVTTRLLKLIQVAGFYAGLIALWQLIYELQIWSPYLLPGPRAVLESLERYVDNGVLVDAVLATLQRMLIGFAIAFGAGMALGIAIAVVRWLDETLGTLVVGMQSLPSITWLPLAIMWFGLSETAIIFVVVMGSVWAIAISARDGVRHIPPLQRRIPLVYGASRWQSLWYVTLPGMLPSMAQGLKLGWSFSWRSLMAGELLFTTSGLGRMLELGRDLNNMALVIGVMAVIVLVGILFDRLLFAPLESFVRQRWGLANP